MDNQKEYANMILRKEGANLTSLENVKEIFKEALTHVDYVMHQIRSWETQQVVIGNEIGSNEIFGVGHVRWNCAGENVEVRAGVIVRIDVHKVSDQEVVQILEPIGCESELKHDESENQGDVDGVEILV